MKRDRMNETKNGEIFVDKTFFVVATLIRHELLRIYTIEQKKTLNEPSQ